MTSELAAPATDQCRHPAVPDCAQVAHHLVSRAGWPDGPWVAEPDRVQWLHRGQPCLLVRDVYGHWFGYAGVGRSHPLFRVSADGTAPYDIDHDVHGGIVVALASPGGEQFEGTWWFAIDGAHAGDRVPAMPPAPGDVYRDLAFMVEQCQRLAAELSEVPA